MRKIFHDDNNERQFREDGYVIFDLLDMDAISDLLGFYAESFPSRRQVVPFARELPYYISVFDEDATHKREVDHRISPWVTRGTESLLDDYEVFYSNFMIKFPGDGQIEAHQDFNFVDESQHTAFNLWCPLVDTSSQNGGLFFIPGSHNVFRTQRGPNIPKALTQYNDLLKRYARCIPLKKGQAAIFDHKLIHYSPPNHSEHIRMAIQAVLKPREAAAIHYVFDAPTERVRAYRIDKEFILNNDLWNSTLDGRVLDHEQPLIPLPAPGEVEDKVIGLGVNQSKRRGASDFRRVLRDDNLQQQLNEKGFATLPLLGPDQIQHLKNLFVQSTGGSVENTAYGMYIGLEEPDIERKRAVTRDVLETILPLTDKHFADCKPHLGSFLVKAPGIDSYTYPHQDWTFIDKPEHRSMTVWTALVDVDESNGALGFVPGSHLFFDKLIGSPSPDFATCAQGHEAIFYEYLEFVHLRAGEAVVFDNRVIHGATPNRSDNLRVAVAIGMTPREAILYHYFLMPQSVHGSGRKLAKLKLDAHFFEKNTVASLKKLYDANQIPGDCEIEALLDDEFFPLSGEEIRKLCEFSGLRPNGRRLELSQSQNGRRVTARISSASPLRRLWQSLLGLST
jgi:ectoine hydroxylase-related dioxygenase (phytanoyl-CoA dioxygenase family)